jgi:hypothetical protein
MHGTLIESWSEGLDIPDREYAAPPNLYCKMAAEIG